MSIGSGPLRVCLWATTLQADLLSLARHLSEDSDFAVMIAMDDPASFDAEPAQRLLPLRCPFVDRSRSAIRQILAWAPEVTVVDNHFPPSALSKKLFVLWHGFGWKGPNDREEFATVHRSIHQLTGFPSTEPNPHFLWQCFGPTDLYHRHVVSGFARENLRNLGSAFSDQIINPPFDRERALGHYPPAFAEGPIFLLAFTWHYGRVFSHWGDDVELFSRLVDHIAHRGGKIILRMHDRQRYEAAYLRQLEGFCQGRQDVLLKYKNQHQDNLLDILVSHVMVSNFSSILNHFYPTGRPSIHVYPVKDANEAFLWRVWKRGKVRTSKVSSPHYVWKLDPEENGGLMARSFDELLMAVDRALDEPQCCVERSGAFLAKHMEPVDGRRCQLIAEAIKGLAKSGS